MKPYFVYEASQCCKHVHKDIFWLVRSQEAHQNIEYLQKSSKFLRLFIIMTINANKFLFIYNMTIWRKQAAELLLTLNKTNKDIQDNK